MSRMLPYIHIITINTINKKKIKNNNIIIDSKSGYSGAGRNVHMKYRNKNLYESQALMDSAFIDTTQKLIR